MARVYIDKPDYKNFQKKVEKFQLAITGRIQKLLQNGPVMN